MKRKSILDLKPTLEPLTTQPFFVVAYSDGYTIETVLPDGVRLLATGNIRARTEARLYTEVKKRGFVASAKFFEFQMPHRERPKGATIQEVQ